MSSINLTPLLFLEKVKNIMTENPAGGLSSIGAININSDIGDINFQAAGVDHLALNLDGDSAGVIVKPMVDGDDLIFQQYDGTEVLRITDDGKVGIGGDPTTILHIQAEDPRLRLDSTEGDHPGFELAEDGNRKWVIYNDPDESHALIFKSTADRVRIMAAGETRFGSHKNIIAVDQNIRYAHSVDNTVIVELPNLKIPGRAIITRVSALVKTLSNLTTHKVNIQMSATSGTGADSAISSGTELLGAGVANTVSTDSASATDIVLSKSPAGVAKDVWLCNDTVRNGTSDQYIYICNAANNGTTNSLAGTLSVVIEYYGKD